ncbi:putative asparaginase [Gordonia hirsuta DSM 44140 = NBRC 16056]|uniref:Putative asparaginase n=1 Tax=Gordonia hirsuta DSM 44140 = NBRC 16056 TaxID=1121927 RepID=L7L8A9_9ACTN|nr:putative asparaginase [Gordonia hirsuta DSM 44140 = NBRC 16056]
MTLRYNTDAFQNVCAAVAAAHAEIPEVGVAFRGHIFRGPRVIKSNASEDNAFSLPNFASLAQVGINFELDTPVVLPGPVSDDVALSNPAVRTRAQERLSHIADHIGGTPVVPLPAFPAPFAASGSTAFIAEIVDALVSAGAKGIVLESCGEGNFPSGAPDSPEDGAVARALRAATQAGVAVVAATQVQAGTVNASAYASGAWLPWAGAIGIGDMTAIAAFTKTMVLLAEQGWGGNEWDAGTVRSLIGQSLVGECAVTDRVGELGRTRLLPGESLKALDGSATLTNHPARGPVLSGADGKALWEALAQAPASLPGTLVADGGSLRLISRDGTTLWEAAPGTSVAGLALRGSLVDGTFELVATAPGGGVAKTVFTAASQS